MKFRDIAISANANLGKSKLRTVLTVSAVFIGALTLMLTTGVGAGLKAYVQEQVQAVGAKDALIIAAQPDEDMAILPNSEVTEYRPEERQASSDIPGLVQLNQDDLDSIASRPEILDVNPIYMIQAQYITAGDKKYNIDVTQSVEGLVIPLVAGRNVVATSDDPEITIPAEFVEPLGFDQAEASIGQTIALGFSDVRGQPFELEATIVGVQEQTLIQANAAGVTIDLMRQAHDQATAGLPDIQRQQYPAAVAQFDDTISDDELKALQASLADDGFMAQTLDDQLGVIISVIDGIMVVLNVFAGIALLAATFGIVNTLLMAVQERTSEIGLMKALGMSRGRIFALFTFEAVLIGLWGAVLAWGAAHLIGAVGNNIASSTFLKDFDGLQLFSFPATSVLPVVGLIMVIAFLAGTLPARRASRLDPIRALRYE